MSRLTVLLDANVLYPAPPRDLLLQLAITDLFRARWSADIHREWIDALLRNEPRRERAAPRRTRDLMDRATRDALVNDYEPLIPTLVLPDDGDRHVLAAAIAGRCDMIVTRNLKHFPDTALAPFGIEARHPDDFLAAQFDQSPSVFCSAVAKVRARLQNPPFALKQYLDTLARQGLVTTAAALEAFADLL